MKKQVQSNLIKKIHKQNQQQNCSMTNCTKTGIKIKDYGNDYKNDPFANFNPFKNTKETNQNEFNYTTSKYENLDLNINNYSKDDLYKLFGFNSNTILNEENLKTAKKIVLKTHPDKSRLDIKYFLFFNQAYETIYKIYEFQNKQTKNTNTNSDDYLYYFKENMHFLDKTFDMKGELKESDKFNKWFNEEFEKHKLEEDPIKTGYGDWLKSDEDIDFSSHAIKDKNTMAREIEKRKKHVQSLIKYQDINDFTAPSSVGCSALMEYESNYNCNSLFSGKEIGYTDLKQAYIESVIPVTEEDFNKIKKYNSLEEYKITRDNVYLNPLRGEELMEQLYFQNKDKEEKSAALVFYYAQQLEKSKKK